MFGAERDRNSLPTSWLSEWMMPIVSSCRHSGLPARGEPLVFTPLVRTRGVVLAHSVIWPRPAQ
jgi:hypothetical protein